MKTHRFALALLTLCLAGCEEPAPNEAPEAPVPAPEPPPEADDGAHEERAPAVDRDTMREHRLELARARRALEAGNREEAVRHYRAAIALDHDGAALCELGWVQFQAEAMDDARTSMERAIAVLPGDPQTAAQISAVGSCLYNLGRLEEAAGDQAAARRYYARSLEVRPNPIVQRRLAGLPGPDGSAPGFDCENDSDRELDLDAWRQRVEAIEGPPSRFDDALAEVGLPGVGDSLFLDPFEEGEPPSVRATVAVVEVRFAAGPGYIVHVRFGEDGASADRVAVLLRRGGPGRFCLAGTVDQDQDMCSTSCLSDDPPFSLQTARLVAPEVDAIRIDTASGACVCGASRGAHHESAFYGVEGTRLVHYVTITRYDAWYTSPVPPVVETEATIELGGAHPRVITVQSAVHCNYQEGGCSSATFAERREAITAAQDERARRQLEDELEAECGLTPIDCEETSRTLRYGYEGGAYQPR